MVFKTKLSWGLAFLFLIIFAIAFFSSYWVQKLSQNVEMILRDNYDSLVYARNMISGIDEMRTAIESNLFNTSEDKKNNAHYLKLFELGKAEFEKNLKSEKTNITEIHEQKYVDSLSTTYEIYLNICVQINKGEGSSTMYFTDVLPLYEKLKNSVNSIYDLNMQAVVRKSEIAKQQAGNIQTYIAVIGSLCIVLALTYFWYFPFYISNTLFYLSNRITALLKNAGITPAIKTKDETYIILEAIKQLENKLGVESPKDGL